MPDTPIGKMLKEWEQHFIEYHPSTPRKIAIAKEDVIKLKALATVYQLPEEAIITTLLSHALREVEEKIPYVAGSKVIRVEEGDPVYEDAGHTPEYLRIKAQLEEEAEKEVVPEH